MTNTINNLPAMVRENGVVDVVRNSMNITTVEAEYDRAMLAQAEEERRDPVGYALRQLKSKRAAKSQYFNSCYSYGDELAFYMGQAYWPELKSAMEAAGLPDMVTFNHEYQDHINRLRSELVRDRPKMARKMVWWPEWQKALDRGWKPPV